MTSRSACTCVRIPGTARKTAPFAFGKWALEVPASVASIFCLYWLGFRAYECRTLALDVGSWIQIWWRCMKIVDRRSGRSQLKSSMPCITTCCGPPPWALTGATLILKTNANKIAVTMQHRNTNRRFRVPIDLATRITTFNCVRTSSQDRYPCISPVRSSNLICTTVQNMHELRNSRPLRIPLFSTSKS